jgi:hypothetical protein
VSQFAGSRYQHPGERPEHQQRRELEHERRPHRLGLGARRQPRRQAGHQDDREQEPRKQQLPAGFGPADQRQSPTHGQRGHGEKDDGGFQGGTLHD